MLVAIGSDHAGFPLKEHLLRVLPDWGVEIEDYGCFSLESTDYPDLAEKVSLAVAQGRAVYGILVCGTGQGMAMTANRIPGIRAAVCQEVFSARAAREHNNANILAIGARVIGTGVAEMIVKEFLNVEFAGGRHQKRLDIMLDIENRHRKQEV